jgi:hypothetical protein
MELSSVLLYYVIVYFVCEDGCVSELHEVKKKKKQEVGGVKIGNDV